MGALKLILILSIAMLFSLHIFLLSEMVTKKEMDSCDERPTNPYSIKYEIDIKEELNDTCSAISESSVHKNITSEFNIKEETYENEEDPLLLNSTSSINTEKSQCDMCQQSFKNKMILRRHIVRNTCIKPFKCLDCDKAYKTSEKLQTHSDFCLGKTCVCSSCGKAFPNQYKLKNHQVSHSDEREFECEEPGCGKSFLRLADLKVHWRIHSGETPFECKDCGAKFKTSSSMRTHEAVHTESRSFPCDLCEMSFKLPQTLKNHKKTHVKRLREHMCNTCGAQFFKKDTLKLHEITHTTDKSFKCNDCDKEFNVLSYLKLHIKRAHSGKPFKCEECPKRFAAVYILNKHMKSHKSSS